MNESQLKSKHGFGSVENIDAAIERGTIDEYDILFLTDGEDHKIGWIDKNGNKIVATISEIAVNGKIETAKTEIIEDAKAYTDKKFEEFSGSVPVVEF